MASNTKLAPNIKIDFITSHLAVEIYQGGNGVPSAKLTMSKVTVLQRPDLSTVSYDAYTPPVSSLVNASKRPEERNESKLCVYLCQDQRSGS